MNDCLLDSDVKLEHLIDSYIENLVEDDGSEDYSYIRLLPNSGDDKSSNNNDQDVHAAATGNQSMIVEQVI